MRLLGEGLVESPYYSTLLFTYLKINKESTLSELDLLGEEKVGGCTKFGEEKRTVQEKFSKREFRVAREIKEKRRKRKLRAIYSKFSQ